MASLLWKLLAINFDSLIELEKQSFIYDELFIWEAVLWLPFSGTYNHQF